MRIKLLGKQLANQIAAGEVVERAASVVKELLENAIDAGADNISVDIEAGGKTLIRIQDNGYGIAKDDLSLAVARHATSKIYQLQDLENVNSLGFRGEALASISSVSRLSIQSISKDSSDESGWGIDTGDESEFANYQAEVFPAAIQQGTRIEVLDLFFNTPARRKFLKTEKTEFRYIETIFKRIALADDKLTMSLSHNNKVVKKVFAATSEQEKETRLKKLISDTFFQCCHKVEAQSFDTQQTGKLSLHGWIADQRYPRSQPDQQYFYVNGRFVRDKLLTHALRQAFQQLFSSQQYPAFVLYFTLPADQVDVNVHPTKHEVRFHQARMIHDFIVSALMQALSATNPVNNISSTSFIAAESQKSDMFEPASSASYSQPITREQVSVNRQAAPLITKPSRGSESHYRQPDLFAPQKKTVLDDIEITAGDTDRNTTTAIDEQPKNSQQTFSGKYLSIKQGAYILLEMSEQAFLVDSLAMCGLINQQFLLKYFDIKQQQVIEQLKKQYLLIPHSVNLSEQEIELLMDWQAICAQMGIEYSRISSSSMVIRTMPQLPFTLAPEVLIKNLISTLKQQHKANCKLSTELWEIVSTCVAKSLETKLKLSDNEARLMIESCYLQLNQPYYQAAVKELDESFFNDCFPVKAQ